MGQREVWDAIAKQWFHFRQKPFPDVKYWLDFLLKKPRGKILEVGCGNCRNLLEFAKAGFECYGIDFSEEMLKHANRFCEKHGINIVLKKANATRLPFKSNTFDYVLCIALLHHLKNEERIKAIKEIHRVLKNDGLALFSVWYDKNALKNSKKIGKKEYLVPWRIDQQLYWRYYYFFSESELKKFLIDAGFKIFDFSKQKNLCFVVQKTRRRKNFKKV